MVEFQNNGPAGSGYIPFDSNTPILQNYTFVNLTWSEIAYEPFQQNGITIHQICTQTPVLVPVVRICAMLPTQLVTVNGTTLSPNRIKWSFQVTSNFPWMSNTSQLALQTSFDTLFSIRNFTAAELAQVNSQNSNSDGFVIEESSSTTGTAVGIATWAVNVWETCNGGAPQQISIFRTAVYQDESAILNETPPPGDPDLAMGISVTNRLVWHTFLTNCPMPGIYWDPDIGSNTNAAPAVVFNLFLILALIVLLL